MKAAILLAASALAALSTTAHAQTAEKFFKGKQITLYVGFSPGGGYDLYARLLAQFMGSHIPGSPKIVPENMPGGGSRVLGNYLFNAAPRDGTVLGTIDQSMPLEQATGDATIKFDAKSFNSIGNMDSDNNVVVTWYASGVKTIADAREKEISIGASGFNTSSQYPTALNTVAGTKFKLIFGYPGGNDINLAMERGEVGGRGSNSWASWKATRPDWIRDHKLNVLVQVGLNKAQDLPDTPLLIDLASNDLDRAAFTLLSGSPAVGRPIFAPPGVPADRVQALRQAFDATMKDPDFLSAAKKAGMDLDPASGEDLQTVVTQIVDTPKAVVERADAVTAVAQQAPSKR